LIINIKLASNSVRRPRSSAALRLL